MSERPRKKQPMQIVSCVSPDCHPSDALKRCEWRTSSVGQLDQ